MNTVNAGFHVCGGCVNKVKDERLPKGAFRCPLVVKIINPNIVWETTDATDCVKEGRYHALCENDDVELRKG